MLSQIKAEMLLLIQVSSDTRWKYEGKKLVVEGKACIKNLFFRKTENPKKD